MTRLQKGVIGGAVLLFLFLYFGFDTKPPEQEQIEKTRALTAESTDIKVLLMDAKSNLTAEGRANVLALEQMIAAATVDSIKVEHLEKLSGTWFKLERPDISGYYAEEIAQIAGSEETWAIAGTTYSICVQRAEEQKIRDFCTGRAVSAFENAISLNPENIVHKVNLALTYTENPPKDNPMKGVLMLRDLHNQEPENVLILKNLGRLAIRTGQFDKAKERLETALDLKPEDGEVHCLLAETYAGLKDIARSEAHLKQCKALTGF